MYCPRCAKQFEAGAAYCRTCGLSLDQVALIVRGEQENEPEIKLKPNRNLLRYGGACFILGIVIALGNAILKDFQLFPEVIGRSIFLSLVMIGMLLIGAGIFFPQKRYVKKGPLTRDHEKQPPVLSTAHLDRLPPADRNLDDLGSFANSRDPDSVTEHTTRHLI